MSKPVSFTDVIKCLNHLGHYGINEIQLLPKSQDEQKSILTDILDERIITSLKNASDRKRAYHEWLKEEK